MNNKILFQMELEQTRLKDMQLGHFKREVMKLNKKVEEQTKKIGAYKTLVTAKNNEIESLKKLNEDLIKNNPTENECTEMLNRINKFLDTRHISIDIYV